MAAKDRFYCITIHKPVKLALHTIAVNFALWFPLQLLLSSNAYLKDCVLICVKSCFVSVLEIIHYCSKITKICRGQILPLNATVVLHFKWNTVFHFKILHESNFTLRVLHGHRNSKTLTRFKFRWKMISILMFRARNYNTSLKLRKT